MRCGASSRIVPRKKKELRATWSRASIPHGGSRACRTPECAKLCSRLWQLRLCRMRCGASSHVTPRKKERTPHHMEQSIHPPRRQQSVPRSGVREALLAPVAAPALPDAVRSVFPRHAPQKRKNSAPHGAEHRSPPGGSRACRTPECAKLCSCPRQLRLCRMRCGASSRLHAPQKRKSSAPPSRVAQLFPRGDSAGY